MVLGVADSRVVVACRCGHISGKEVEMNKTIIIPPDGEQYILMMPCVQVLPRLDQFEFYLCPLGSSGLRNSGIDPPLRVFRI